MNAADVMTCALAREVRPADVVGVGLGTPLALCAALVAQRLDAPEATVLVGGAVSPRATLDQMPAARGWPAARPATCRTWTRWTWPSGRR